MLHVRAHAGVEGVGELDDGVVPDVVVEDAVRG